MRELRLVMLAIAALIALYLGTASLMRAFRGSQPASGAAATGEGSKVDAPGVRSTRSDDAGPAQSAEASGARAAIERSIADTPDFARFFDRLRVAFPDDYDAIMNVIATRYAGKEVNVDAVMADAVAALRKARGSLAAKSSDAALEQIYAMQLRDMQALQQQDPHLCVALLYGASVAGFTRFSAEHRVLVADTAVATLDAMQSGRTDQVQRSAPSDTDFKTVDRALVAKSLTRPEIDTLLDGTPANPPIADDAMCRAGQTYLETLAGLPSDLRARIYQFSVDLMAKS